MNIRQCAESLQRLFPHDIEGNCYHFTHALHEYFPEYVPVCGEATLNNGSVFTHWWLMSITGDIVDPTAKQFETEYFWYAGIKSYRAFTPEELAEIGQREKAIGVEGLH